MPEIPDLEAYRSALRTHAVGQTLGRVELRSPFLLRTATPPIAEAEGRALVDIGRLGKRLIFSLEGDHHLVLHLMIAGRLQWKAREAKIPERAGLAAFRFESGTLILTEASKKKRASLHFESSAEAMRAHDRGGVEPLDVDVDGFRAALGRENRTLKRALTDPRLLSGVGNAYSDEILHAAELSPTKRTASMGDAEWLRLFEATQEVLMRFIAAIAAEAGDGFPSKVTAFRADMAVHGKFGEPCPRCGAKVQRIVYASNESNYCAPCQTGGKLLADRALSRLLKGDWPKTLDALEARNASASTATKTRSR